jgi:hypothetical protein
MVTALPPVMSPVGYDFLNPWSPAMQSEANMPLNEIRGLAVQNLRRGGGALESEARLGRAVLEALVQAGVDLKQGPTLDEMKTLLADVARLARREAKPKHTAA